jgi:hypothetical protein
MAGSAEAGCAVRWIPEIDERFEVPVLDPAIWIPYYLPHWSSRERTSARYEVGGGSLRLRIDRDQPAWSPEFDGPIRVSSLQTGVFAGPVGSSVGQLRFREGLIVREAQESRALFTPRYGRLEIEAAALDDPHAMVAGWMIGYGDAPERTGEICIFEIFGHEVADGRALVGMGIHPFGDPALVDDFEKVPVEIDVRQQHQYAVEWLPGRVTLLVDGSPVKTAAQAPDYPMQLMLGIYEFPDRPEPPSPPESYPKVFEVRSFRAWRPG